MSVNFFRCERCGNELLRKTKLQRYCSDCRKAAQLENQRAYRARIKAERGSNIRKRCRERQLCSLNSGTVPLFRIKLDTEML